MSVIIRTAMKLEPSCRLYYDCPLKGDDWRANEFFDKYRGRHATFIGYHEHLVGPLDYRGREPGRYINTEFINVRFDGEDCAHRLDVQHFVVDDTNPDHVQLAEAATDDQRLGDLPHPILFYPGDTVRFVNKPEDCLSNNLRIVRGVFLSSPFANDGVPRYGVGETSEEISERKGARLREANVGRLSNKTHFHSVHVPLCWNVTGTNLTLIERGNVWALYHNPDLLSFISDEGELEFWGQDGICRYVTGEIKKSTLGVTQGWLDSSSGLTLNDALRIFDARHADIISPTHSNPGEPLQYSVKVLHDRWVEHRERVRALTQRLIQEWISQINQPAA